MNQLRVIWAAILMSTIVYFIILWTSMHDRPFTRSLENALRDPVTIGTYVLAIVIYFAAFMFSGSLERRHGHRAAGLRTAAIIRFAMLEVVCLVGLVLAFVAGDWRLYLPTFVLAFIGFARSLPRERYEV